MLTMPAAVVIGVKQVRCEETPIPEPEPGMVLVRSKLASICGSDLHVAYQGWSVREFPLPPGRPGHEAVGEVVDGGGTDYSESEVVLTVPKIWTAQAFAGYQLIEPEQLLRLPDTTPLPHLLMAQQLGTVVFACKRLPSLHDKTVVVIGQGSAGLFHDFMLRRLGAHRIIAVEPIKERLAAAGDMGVDEVIDVTGCQADEAVMDLTNGEGADIVVEAVGSTETLNQAIRLSRPRGVVAAFGLPDSSGPVPFDWSSFFVKSLQMHAIHSSQEVLGLPDFRLAIDLIDRGEIDVSPFLTHQLPIADVQAAFDLADAKDDGALKVSLTF